MRITAIMAGAALVAFAVPASAQVAGGLGGRVGGGVSVSPGNMGVRDTVGSARDFARDTVSDARDMARERAASASVDARADARADASASRGGANAGVGLDAYVGAAVHSRGGEVVGRLVGTAQDATSRAQMVLIEGADGVIRGVQASEVSADATGAVTADLTSYEFRRRPEMADNNRRDPGVSDEDRIN